MCGDREGGLFFSAAPGGMGMIMCQVRGLLHGKIVCVFSLTTAIWHVLLIKNAHSVNKMVQVSHDLYSGNTFFFNQINSRKVSRVART